MQKKKVIFDMSHLRNNLEKIFPEEDRKKNKAGEKTVKVYGVDEKETNPNNTLDKWGAYVKKFGHMG